jgi:hypothetical protein
MARLSTTTREKLPKSSFGLPGAKSAKGGKGKYPMPDQKHARLAKAMASKEEHAGKLSKAAEEKIDAKADRKLGTAPAKGKKKKK